MSTGDRQIAQGSTADYCSRWPGEPHAISTHMRNGIAVRRCDSCGWIDFDDLRAQRHDAYERGKAEGISEGRRQATEGWEREWGAQYRSDSWVQATFDDQASATEFAAGAIGHRAVSRLVGPWEPAEQPEAHWMFCSYCYSARQHNSRHCRSDGTCCETSAEQPEPNERCTCGHPRAWHDVQTTLGVFPCVGDIASCACTAFHAAEQPEGSDRA